MSNKFKPKSKLKLKNWELQPNLLSQNRWHHNHPLNYHIQSSLSLIIINITVKLSYGHHHILIKHTYIQQSQGWLHWLLDYHIIILIIIWSSYCHQTIIIWWSSSNIFRSNHNVGSWRLGPWLRSAWQLLIVRLWNGTHQHQNHHHHCHHYHHHHHHQYIGHNMGGLVTRYQTKKIKFLDFLCSSNFSSIFFWIFSLIPNNASIQEVV